MSAYINKSHEKARELLVTGKPNEALKLLEQLLIKWPDHPDLFSDRGVVYLHLGDSQKALLDMSKAVDLQPDYGFRYASRAFVRDNLGDIEGAINDYEMAIKLDPEDAISLNNLGLLEEKRGYTQKARAIFDLADKLNRNEGVPGASDQSPQKDSTSSTPVKIEPDNTTYWQHVKNVFVQDGEFREMLRFISRGFKTK